MMELLNWFTSLNPWYIGIIVLCLPAITIISFVLVAFVFFLLINILHTIIVVWWGAWLVLFRCTSMEEWVEEIKLIWY